MLHIYLDLVPQAIGDLLTLSTQIFKKHVPDDRDLEAYLENLDDKVWEVMRTHDELPHIGEVYTNVVMEFCEMVVQRVMPDADIIVDADELSINNQSIGGWRDFNAVYKAYEEEQNEIAEQD
ncbi:MAG: hypothetical protein ACTIJH_07495 [Moraxellaceae bacterium]